jgi:hypothetical protein
MFMTKGGTVVEKGLYWNPMDGQRVALMEEGILPGDEGRNYLKMSPLGLLVIAPLLGMMYVIFLPLFGIGVFLVSWLVPIISTFAQVAITGVKLNSRIHGKSAMFGWNPSKAYFSGRRKQTKTTDKNAVDSSGTRKGGR